MTFDKEKWRAELATKARDNFMGREDHGLVPQSDALEIAERAYAEGRADGACEVIEMARRTAAARGTP